MEVGCGWDGDWYDLEFDSDAVTTAAAEAVGSGGSWSSRRLKGSSFEGALCATRGSMFSFGGGGSGVETCGASLWGCIFRRLNGSAAADILCDIEGVSDVGGNRSGDERCGGASLPDEDVGGRLEE